MHPEAFSQRPYLGQQQQQQQYQAWGQNQESESLGRELDRTAASQLIQAYYATALLSLSQ
jgi:hypothetical protein